MKLVSCPKLECGRSVPPEQTVQTLEAIIGSKFNHWMHEEQVAEHLYWSALFIEDMDFRAMGKGTSALLSRAGALAEAAEWLTCRETARLPGYITAHQEELNPSDIVPIEALLSHIATATPPVLEQVKELDDALHWVDGYSMNEDRIVKVPIEYVGLIGGPNGKAAGNTLEEAVEHAILEIFERRAHITVLRNKLILPTIDPKTIEDPLLLEQMAFIQDKGIEIILKDLSFGGSLPCVGAYFLDPNIPDDYQFHHFFKVGSSFNRSEALMRTFTEYTQGRMRDEFIDGSRSEQERVLQHDFRSLRVMGHGQDNFLSAFMFGFVPCRHADFLREGEMKTFDPGPCYKNSLEDIKHSHAICRELDRDMVIVDYTDPEIGFAVAHVIVPGYSDALPFHPASSPGLFRRLTRSEVLKMYQT